MKVLTNREMAESLGIPISKIRRNTKEFLGEDPRAARRAGIKREFSVNDGFFVYLGGELVTNYNLSFGNARRALEAIKPWLLKNAIVPDKKGCGVREGVDAGGPFAEAAGPDDPVSTEFYVTFYLHEGRIIEICEIRVVAASDICEKVVDSIGRKYHTRHVEEYYYHMKNNRGKIEYFVVYTKRFEGPGFRFGLSVDNEENKKIFGSLPVGEIPVSKMENNFIRSIYSSGDPALF